MKITPSLAEMLGKVEPGQPYVLVRTERGGTILWHNTPKVTGAVMMLAEMIDANTLKALHKGRAKIVPVDSESP
jgi:hypothetical protein